MGIMLGEFIDFYSAIVIDVFPTPEVGNAITATTLDIAYQLKMVE